MAWRNIEELYDMFLENKLITKEILNLYYICNENELQATSYCSCGRVMKLRKQDSEYSIYGCSFCDKRIKIKKINSSIKTKIDNLKLVRILFLYTLNIPNNIISEMCKLNAVTVSKIILAVQKKIDTFENEKIGGVDNIVQLDECCFGKSKYNRGRIGNRKWVFGGINIADKSCFMNVVPNRKAETLGSIIVNKIHFGTTIYTDQYPSYLKFFNNNEAFLYDNVDHSKYFINPDTGAHTQNIENLWSQFKKFKRKKSYSKLKYLQLYLNEFMLRRKYNIENRWQLFEYILNKSFF